MSVPYSQYPNLLIYRGKVERIQAVERFVEDLRKQGIIFCTKEHGSLLKTPKDLIYEHFDIDHRKLDEERARGRS